MKKIYRIALSAALALAASLTAFVPVTSCDGHHPIEVIQTDYSYSVDADDIHIADGARAECIIHLTSASVRDESITVGYRVDDDAALHVYVNGKEIVSGASVPLDATGSIVLTMPELGEGLHVLHLTLTNRYGKTVSKDVSFQVIRDKVWAKGVSAPAMVKMEKGSYVDTAVAVIPADSDILALSVTSSAPDVVRASLAGDGAEKVLRLEGLSDGSASVSLSHEDIEGPAATVAVEVYSYKIEGLPATMSLVEGADATVTLSVMPAAPVTLVSSSPCLSVTTAADGVWTLRAVSPGTATLVATAGRTQASCVVTVAKKPETIAVSPMSAIIASGGTKAFSVVSSADFTAVLSSDAATIIERTATGVTVRNDNRSFRDAKATLTVSNVADPTKRAVADIMLEKRAETITLAESVSEAGRSIWSVGGENDGWTLVSSPSGLRCEATGNTIVLTNATYKSVSGAIVVKTKEQGVTATKDVTVQGLDVKLSSLTADPVSFSVEEGKSVSLVIRGTYNDGTVKDVTNAVTWTQSSNLQRNGNTFYAVEPGSAWVRASLDDKSVSIDGNVTKKPVYLNSMEIDPAYFTALVDESRLFSVTANFSDGTHRDVTRDCEWSVTGSAIASGKGYYKFTAPGEVLVEASYTHEGTTLSARSVGNITKPSGTVTGVTVEPKEKRLKVGETVTFSGTVRYSDGTTDASGTFTVSPAGILSGANGSYVAVAEGTVSVTYSYSGYSATAVVTVSANGPGGGDDADVVKEIILNTATLTVYAGKASSVTATAVMGDGSAKDVTNQAVWSSSNSGVATVDSFGRITGVKAGTATITVNYSGKSATCSVVVEEEVSLVSVSVTPSSLAFTVGDPSQHVSAKAYFSDGTSRDVTNIGTWSTSDGSVATVSAGTIAPGSEGSATVSCRYQGKEGSCSVRVSRAAVVVTAATMSQSTATLTVGESLSLKVTYKFSDGSSGDYTYGSSWSSSNTSVVTVKKGTVTAVKPGTATITAYLRSENEPKATCVVTVSNPPATLSSVRLNASSLSIQEGETYTLPGDFRLTAVMSDGSTRDVTSSATWSILSGSQNMSLSGLTLRGVKKTDSPVYLQCSYTYGGVTKDATVYVTVTEKAAPTVQSLSASSFSLTVGESATMTNGSKFKVYAKMSDGSTEDVTSKATYTVVSQNPSGAVSQNGNVIVGNKAGSGTLRAAYGGKTVDFAFTVTEKTVPVTSVSLNKKNMSVSVNGSETLSVTFNGGGEVPTNTAVTWSSSQPGIARVDQYGKVTGVAVGTCDVTVTTVDGGKRASCHVTVTPEVIAVERVSVAPSTASLVVGGTISLTATITPPNASNQNVSWSSNDNSVATVDADGTVTGRGVGSAKITVETEDGYKTASCNVTVTAAPKPVEWVKIYDNDGEITSRKDVPNGGTIRLEAVVNDGASIASYEWSSTSRNVTISSPSRQYTDIQFNAMEQTSVSVKVTDSQGGSKTATAQFDVKNFEYLITSTPSSLEWEWDKSGKNNAQSISVTYENVTNPSISVSGNFSANFENGNNINKILVYPLQQNTSDVDVTGTLTIKDNSGKAKQVKIPLTQTAKPAVKPKSVTLSVKNGGSTTIWDSQSVTLVASVTGDDGNVMSDEKVSWDYDGNYLNGSEKGMELTLTSKAYKAGGVTVTAYAKSDGNVKESITISPNLHVTGVSLDQTSLSLRKGETCQLSATVKPEGATDKSVMWASSNSSAVSVTQDGRVTINQESSATITVTTTDGKKTASCNVSVPVSATSVTISGENDGTYDKDYNGGHFTLTASLSPSGATPAEVIWSVDNSKIVSINKAESLECLFDIKGVGQATVYAKWEGDQSVAGQYNVTIKDGTQLIAFDPNNDSYTVKVGETKNITTGVGYMQGNQYTQTHDLVSRFLDMNKNWSVSISPSGIIEYNQSKNTVKGLKVGTATITLKNQTAQQETNNSITITVDEPKGEISIPYSTSLPLDINVGDSKTVSASLIGAAGSGTWKWESSNSYIASISGSGDEVSIQGKYVGNADITVSYGDLEPKTFTVNVKDPGQEDVIVTGLDPQVDGTKVRIVASFMNVVTYAEWTEDVTKDVEITDVSSGLTVTKKSSSPTDYYLLVDAKKNGTFVFTVEYKTESFTLHVTKSSGNISIY